MTTSFRRLPEAGPDETPAPGGGGRRRGYRVVGLDPGSRVTGWGVVDERNGRLRAADHGVVRCAAKEPLARRLARLYRGISKVIVRLEPDAAAVESVFSAVSAGSALTLGHARGAVIAALGELPLAEYAPRAVKKALTGYGNAGKPAVAVMVARRLGLREPPRPEDAADALAVAICHLDARRAARRFARATGRSAR